MIYLAMLLIISHVVICSESLTYKELYKNGIVSGFGVKNGHPLDLLDQITPINSPKYVKANSHLYPKNELCIGTLTPKGWKFSPINVLNRHEIIHNGKSNSLCFCPLAGLVTATPSRIGVSGLLKYDAFLLYDYQSKELILPYSQKFYKTQKSIAFSQVQLITFEGMMKYFPNSFILDNVYSTKDPYGKYSSDTRLGIGHENPGLKIRYESNKMGFHPKERVLVIGFDGKLQKAYPFSELRKVAGNQTGSLEDSLDHTSVYIYYKANYDWAYAEDEKGNSLNVGYSYIFALYQHRPDIPIYKK